jgi:hypothetical protein
MKKIVYLIQSVMVVAVLFFTSCEADKGPIYQPEYAGVSFQQARKDMVYVPTDTDTSVEIKVSRGTTKGAETIGLTSDGSAIFSVPGSVTFNDGENEATFAVGFGDLAFGVDYIIDIALPAEKVSPAGTNVLKLVVSKDYEWVPLGKAKFSDTWTLGPKVYSVDVLKADGYERYRLVKPYAEGLKDDDGEWEDWISNADGPEYVDFWDIGGELIRFRTYLLGINYEANATTPIKCYYPADLSSTLDFARTKKISDKVYQFAPYFYMDGVGGWNRTTYDNVIRIELP